MSTMFKNKMTFDLTCTFKSDEQYILKLTTTENQSGIIYKVTAVLFAYGWDILEANFETMSEGIVKDIFIIQNFRGQKMNDSSLKKIKQDLSELFFQDLLVIDYLERFSDLQLTRPSLVKPVVHVFNPSSIDSTVLDLRTSDRPGLLFEISQLLYLMDIDILSVTAKTEDQMVRDSFLLRLNKSERLDEGTMQKLKEGLLGIL